MAVTTTRTLAQLRVACTEAGVQFTAADGREALFDALRDKVGLANAVQLDPMKAKDLKSEIDWAGEDRFAKLTRLFNDQHVMEPKLDGCRMITVLGTEHNTMTTGRRSVQTYGYLDRSDNFPHIRDAFIDGLAGTIIDGEILSPSTQIKVGTKETDSLLNASVALVNAGPEKSVAAQEKYGRAIYYVFDVLAVKGIDVTDRTYAVRRQMLELVAERLARVAPEIRLVLAMESAPENIQLALDQGFEGVMIKSRAGTYQPGKRSPHWLKVKTMSTADAFIVGWAEGSNANAGKVGSLDLAIFEPCSEAEFDATALPVKMINGVFHRHRAVAQVGNLTDAFRNEITGEDGSLKSEWYGRVIEFMGQGVGRNSRVRHPHMLRLRPDKTAADCLVDQLDVFPKV